MGIAAEPLAGAPRRGAGFALGRAKTPAAAAPAKTGRGTA
jgi:hypothetical protein